ncbi:uncharacterized protein LOC131658734 [Vicia villosa]|uniref:uncharacterized protein LOC131658734 n=1 Tax=Vicia villosa TaxID=3911 RepID=UPI00273AA8FD|nr:uncharacterized protein LOC131658734 [Vicia villosa]
MGVPENWGIVWKIKAPPRVKHLIWRICRDCLPTRERLRNRFVECPPDCQFCASTTEDEWHLFLTCTVTNQCWRAAGLSHLIDSRLHSFQDIKSLIFYICSKESKEVSGRFAVMLDVLWKNRNDYVWHNEQEEASTLGLKATYLWNEWFQAQERLTSNARLNHALEWSPPPVGWLKCNVDAAFNNNNGTTNRGWCVRNHFGNFIYAGIAWDPGTLRVIEAEALALKEAILRAISSNLEFVIFESDSQTVTQAVLSNKKGDSEFCLIIESILFLLSSSRIHYFFGFFTMSAIGNNFNQLSEDDILPA